MKETPVQDPPRHQDGLQLEEDRSFQNAFWTAERIAWGMFGLFVLAALLGLTGAGGYYANSRISVPTGELLHPRIARWNSTEMVKVTFVPGNDTRRLTIGRPFFEHFRVTRIDPPPVKSTQDAEGTVMQFSAQPAVPLMVIIHLRAYRPGFPRFSMALDGIAVEMSPSILP
jgi:hypothetical protein